MRREQARGNRRIRRRLAARRKAGRIILVLVVAGAVLTGRGVLGQPADPQGREAVRDAISALDPHDALNRLIRLLDAPDLNIRQETSETLAFEDRITLQMVEQALARDDLTPEQRQRLLSAGRRKFERIPHAAMGVRFSNSALRTRVVLEGTIERFNADELLERGDMIVEAGGVVLRGINVQERLRSIIISHEGGEEMDLVVRRGAERLHIKLQLGRFMDLPQPQLSAQDLDRAWRVRLQRRGVGRDEPIRLDLGAAQWSEMERSSRQQHEQRDGRARAPGQAGPPHVLLAGGRPRLAALDDLAAEKLSAVLLAGGEIGVQDFQALQQRGPGAFAPGVELVNITLHDELEQLHQQVRSTADSLRNMRDQQRAGHPVALSSLEVAERQLELLEKLIPAIQAEIAESDAASAPDGQG